jgi:hypothetical protein
MGHIDPDPLPEGAGDGVGGVDPAVRVQHVLIKKNVVEGLKLLVILGFQRWAFDPGPVLQR